MSGIVNVFINQIIFILFIIYDAETCVCFIVIPTICNSFFTVTRYCVVCVFILFSVSCSTVVY